MAKRYELDLTDADRPVGYFATVRGVIRLFWHMTVMFVTFFALGWIMLGILPLVLSLIT